PARDRPDHLFPHSRRLPAPARAGEPECAVRGDRRGVHRERSRGGAADARAGRHDARSRSGAWRARVPRGPRSIPGGLLPREGRRTREPDTSAAGDDGNFENRALGAPLRVEHEGNANTMGRTAGLNMAGRTTPYHQLRFFYSDLFELGYEAVGDVDARLETVA